MCGLRMGRKVGPLVFFLFDFLVLFLLSYLKLCCRAILGILRVRKIA
jgi:hypothetical protein